MAITLSGDQALPGPPLSSRLTPAQVWGIVLLAPYLAVAVRRLVQWLPGVLTFIGTTYLGSHWFTDSLGGYLLGLIIARLLLRVPWRTVPLPRWLDRPPP